MNFIYFITPINQSLNLLIGSGLIIFLIGLIGIFLNQNSIINILLSIELTLLSINLLMLTYSAIFDDLIPVLFVLYILSVAAAESAIGLALIIIWFRIRKIPT